MYSMGVLSLNHGITTSLRLRSTPISPKFHPKPVQAYQWKGEPRCSFTAYQGDKHFVYITYWCGMHSMGGLSLNHGIATSLRLRATPISPKFHPKPAQAYQCEGGLICSFTAYQGNKFLYIQYRCGMHSTGGFEPQPWHYNITWAQVYPNIPKIPPQTCTGITVKGWTHMPIHSISRW